MCLNVDSLVNFICSQLVLILTNTNHAWIITRIKVYIMFHYRINFPCISKLKEKTKLTIDPSKLAAPTTNKCSIRRNQKPDDSDEARTIRELEESGNRAKLNFARERDAAEGARIQHRTHEPRGRAYM